MNSLHCSIAGNSNNPPLLLLHGFLGSSSDWQFLAENLSSDYYCLAIDLPGHGKSASNDLDNSYNIENTAKRIIDFLQTNKIKKCNLLGYSMGGRIAIYLAIHYPIYFNKIIIESAQPGIKDKTERNQRKIHDAQLSRNLISSSLPEFLDFWYNQPIFETLKKHKKFANLLEARLINNPKLLSKSLVDMGAGTQPSLWIDLKKIKNPCLLITGEFDTKYQKVFSKMHKEIYTSSFVVLKDSGHNTHFENSDEFIKVVKKFLRNKGV